MKCLWRCQNLSGETKDRHVNEPTEHISRRFSLRRRTCPCWLSRTTIDIGTEALVSWSRSRTCWKPSHTSQAGVSVRAGNSKSEKIAYTLNCPFKLIPDEVAVAHVDMHATIVERLLDLCESHQSFASIASRFLVGCFARGPRTEHIFRYDQSEALCSDGARRIVRQRVCETGSCSIESLQSFRVGFFGALTPFSRSVMHEPAVGAEIVHIVVIHLETG